MLCMISSNQYPYQDTNLKDLTGERWRDIPGFEGYYMVSCYGRIKSVERTITGRWGKDVNIHARILKSKITVTSNQTIGVPIYSLAISLNRDGIKYCYAIGRLVYHCFIAPIEMSGRSELVSFRDKDGRNTYYYNLYTTSVSDMLLEAYNSKRHKSHLHVLSKPVTQYNSTGKPIAWYPSFYDAAKQTGFESSAIASAANQASIIYKGSFWRTGHHKRKLNLTTIATGYPLQPLINKTLQKRLGIEITPGAALPACLNLSLDSMKGGRWKPFPYHEGLYEISNYGRVKSLRRVSVGKQSKWVLEKIKMLTFDFRMGANGKEIPGAAFVALDKGISKKLYSVARYVYYCFIAPFELENSTLRIYYKDKITYNLHYKNLLLKGAVWSITKIDQPYRSL